MKGNSCLSCPQWKRAEGACAPPVPPAKATLSKAKFQYTILTLGRLALGLASLSQLGTHDCLDWVLELKIIASNLIILKHNSN